MEAEVSELIGAERGARTEDRATHRNGYRPRRWDTRAGEIELHIPKIRQGSYFRSFLQPRKRSEQSLVSPGPRAPFPSAQALRLMRTSVGKSSSTGPVMSKTLR